MSKDLTSFAINDDSDAWYSVETPQVFREYRLPNSEVNWTAAHQRKHDKLAQLAEQHGTYVFKSAYRRG